MRVWRGRVGRCGGEGGGCRGARENTSRIVKLKKAGGNRQIQTTIAPIVYDLSTLYIAYINPCFMNTSFLACFVQARTNALFQPSRSIASGVKAARATAE